MNLFGWLRRKDKVEDFIEDHALVRDIERQAVQSKATRQRIDRMVDIEQVRLRNIELRAEVLSRIRGE